MGTVIGSHHIVNIRLGYRQIAADKDVIDFSVRLIRRKAQERFSSLSAKSYTPNT